MREFSRDAVAFLYLKVKSLQILVCRWFLSVFFGIFIFPILLLIELFREVRIVYLRDVRLGHLSLEPDSFLRGLQANVISPKPYYLFIAGKSPCNRQLLEMFKRYLNIVESDFLHRVLEETFLLKRTKFYFHLEQNIYNYKLFADTNATLGFTAEEESRGKKWLESAGIGDKDWFVCIFARDPAYLNAVASYSKLYGPALKNDWSYHDRRNCDINSYRLAIEYILSLGGYVIRMGHHIEKPLNYKHERVIDYATKHRTEFLDVYLSAKCRFSLGTSAGITDLSSVFDVPRVTVNFIFPFEGALVGKNHIFIPKKIKLRETGQYVVFARVFNPDLWRIKGDVSVAAPTQSDFDYEDNSELEILQVTREMVEREEGRFEQTGEDKKLLDDYYKMISPHPLLGRTPIGRDFLRANRELFA